MAEIRTAHLMTLTLAVAGMQAVGATPNGNRVDVRPGCGLVYPACRPAQTQFLNPPPLNGYEQGRGARRANRHFKDQLYIWFAVIERANIAVRVNHSYISGG